MPKQLIHTIKPLENHLINQHPLDCIDFTCNNQAYLIEASAGTGKTWTVEHLFIKSLLEATVDGVAINLSNILVVTFTNDATDELKARIQTQIQNTFNQIIYLHNTGSLTNHNQFTEYLQTRINTLDYKKDLQILNRALQNFDNASIFTIHGFCNKVLRDYQFESKTNNGFGLVTDRSDVIQHLVTEFIRSRVITNSKFITSLDKVMSNLEAFFTTKDYNLTLIRRIASKIPKDLFIIENGVYKLKYKLLEPKLTLEEILTSELDGINDKELKSEFLVHLIQFIATKYQSVCDRQNNALSYDDLIQKVADSLTSNIGLVEEIFEQYPVAFIDEFQDTDSLQWQIFSQIYKLDQISRTDNSSDAHHLANGRGILVAVGDPKQAIYHFRGADINTYLNARNHMNKQFELFNNFRSTPNIVNFINKLFQESNQENCFGDKISYHPITANQNSSDKLPSSIKLKAHAEQCGILNHKFYDDDVHLVVVNGKTKNLRRQNLLKSLTFEILALLNIDHSLKGKIAILVTKNREATEIVNYLRVYGVKATELKLGNIYATKSAHELYKILFALFDLTNKRAFTQAISTSLFNLPLTELSITTSEEVSRPLIEKMQQRFFYYKQVLDSSGVFSLIYAILLDMIMNDENSNLSIRLTNRELANLWQLAELLNKQHYQLNNPLELLLWFKSKLSNVENKLSTDLTDIDGNNEELIRLDNDDEQILVTTQHGAKGLEFDIVFCPYFKNNIHLDGANDYNYRRPFFSSYTLNGHISSEIIMDEVIGHKIVDEDNKETNRLNYVALTRAKSRLYIYLKQPTLDKFGRKYNASQKPDKIVELFGYVKNNPEDNSHKLFNYSKFFSTTPELAIKSPNELKGVVSYNLNTVTLDDLEKLRLNSSNPKSTIVNINPYVTQNFAPIANYVRQSYSGLTKIKNDQHSEHDYYTDSSTDLIISGDNNLDMETSHYRYQVLFDNDLKGAVFGTLFHGLCELYPFTTDQLMSVLSNYNINKPEYVTELSQMIDEAFKYKILYNQSLNDLNTKIHELDFNLYVTNSISLKSDIASLIGSYFGINHPFTLACHRLDEIKSGFLVGFIDLCFEHNGKYWVLDYKTNKLDDYTFSEVNTNHNAIVESMAEHHYYLQYLLYLVALKRYLEKRLKIDDATNLIGGAIYYYVRGIYTINPKDGDGIYTDVNCQNLVSELDKLLLN